MVVTNDMWIYISVLIYLPFKEKALLQKLC